jgi:drug/metabolite transporter (DMT)-like permease
MRGAALAVISGGLASGLGYVLWYAVLPALTATRAASVQLSVPVIAAGGGVLFLDEILSVRLVPASLATLGGIALVIADRSKRLRSRS